MNVKDLRRVRAGLAEELDISKKMVKPPYMFSDVVDELFPTLRNTTIGEALEDVWDAAFREAAAAVNRYLDGLVQ